jgi:hypothetical protein
MQATQKFDNKRVDCKKLNDTKVDENMKLNSQTGLELQRS